MSQETTTTTTTTTVTPIEAVIGFQCKLFRGTAGATATTLVRNVKDVTPNKEINKIDVTTRATDGWKVYERGLKDASLEVAVQYDPSDADYKAFHSSWETGTPIALFESDGQGNGIDADWICVGESSPHPLEEAIVSTFTFAPSFKAGRKPIEISTDESSSATVSE